MFLSWLALLHRRQRLFTSSSCVPKPRAKPQLLNVWLCSSCVSLNSLHFPSEAMIANSYRLQPVASAVCGPRSCVPLRMFAQMQGKTMKCTLLSSFADPKDKKTELNLLCVFTEDNTPAPPHCETNNETMITYTVNADLPRGWYDVEMLCQHKVMCESHVGI